MSECVCVCVCERERERENFNGSGTGQQDSAIIINLYNFLINNSFPFHQTLTFLVAGNGAHMSVSELHRLGFCNSLSCDGFFLWAVRENLCQIPLF